MKKASSLGAMARRIVSITIITVILAAAAIPTIVENATTEKGTHDFAPIYHAAQAMATGHNIYSATAGLYIYPPFLAFIFQPLALLPEHAAAIVWVILSALLITLAALIAAKEITQRWAPERRMDQSFVWLTAAIPILLAGEKIHADFRLGQTDCLMILGFACVLHWMDSKPWLAGLAVGITANMKYLSLICVPYFVIKRNYRAAIAAIVSSVFLMIIPALEVGFKEAARFAASAIGALVKMADLAPHHAVHGIKIPRTSWERSVSITSMIMRATRMHGFPDWIAAMLVLLALVAIVSAIILLPRRFGVILFRPQTSAPLPVSIAVPTLEWAAIIVLALVFSPQTTARHMVLLLLVYVVSVGVLFVQRQHPNRLVLISAMVITSLGLSFPPRRLGINEALWAWRAIAGVSWCAVFLLLVTLWYGSQTISRRTEAQRLSKPETFG